MNDIEKFLKKDIIFNCRTEEDAVDFFKKIKDKIKWCNGEHIKTDELNWGSYKEETCYRISSCGMEYCSVSYYKYNKFKIVKYSVNKYLVEIGE